MGIQKGSDALRNLVNLINNTNGTSYSWRFLNDGSIWIGNENWDEVPTSFEYYIQDNRVYENMIVTDLLSPYIIPGMNIPDIGKVNYIEYYISEKGVKANMWLEDKNG